jgi:hypothetical protein
LQTGGRADTFALRADDLLKSAGLEKGFYYASNNVRFQDF